MKVIDNYTRAVENSDESLLNEVFSPDVHLEVPAGPSVNYPGNITSHILSQVAKTVPGIKCNLTANARDNWYFLGF